MISQYSNLWGYVLDLYQNAEFGKTVDMFQIKQILYVSNFLVPWIVESILDTKLSVISFLFHSAICQPRTPFRLFIILKRQILRILIGKKHPKIKLQRLQKIRIWTFGSLVHQINSFWEVLKLKQILKKSSYGKTPLFVRQCQMNFLFNVTWKNIRCAMR